MDDAKARGRRPEAYYQYVEDRAIPAADNVRRENHKAFIGQIKRAKEIFSPWLFFYLNPGNDLLSHTISRAVPSAWEGLTAVFGMVTGVAPPLWSPGNLNSVLSVTS